MQRIKQDCTVRRNLIELHEIYDKYRRSKQPRKRHIDRRAFAVAQKQDKHTAYNVYGNEDKVQYMCGVDVHLLLFFALQVKRIIAQVGIIRPCNATQKRSCRIK